MSGGAVSPFQALCTALSATIGTGNIAGVAYAIAMGGAGAVFWMWVAAFIGMITKYAESVLAVTYRVQTADGYRGGAMYYLKYGLAERFGLKRTGAALACLFSAATVAASFGIGNLSQVAAIRDSVLAAAGAPEGTRGLLIAGIVMCAVAFVILGGAERIAKANERLVPFMAALYIGGALVILLVHADRVLPAFGRIFREAFSLRSAAGGAGGMLLARGLTFGLRRGIFSNEAGLGSSATVHAASAETDPAKQGLWGMFEVFFDTGVICTVTALVILTACDAAVIDAAGGAEDGGFSLAVYAFSDVFGCFGGVFIAAAVTLFAFSSLLGWSFYGVRAWEFLFGGRGVGWYRMLFVAAVFFGAFLGTADILRLSDIFNGLMALPNLAGVLLLSGSVAAAHRPDFAKTLSVGTPVSRCSRRAAAKPHSR